MRQGTTSTQQSNLAELVKSAFTRSLPYAPYFLLTLLILGPLLQPGFILTMDMTFTPKLRMPDHLDNTYLFYTFLHGLNFILPADIIQKLILGATLLLSGVGMHRLIRGGSFFTGFPVNPRSESRTGRLGMTQSGATWAPFVAGLLYTINPFTYSRLMVGQFAVVLGYALLPWFVRSLFTFLQQPDRRQMLRLSAWTLTISIISIHILGMTVLITLVALILHWWQHRHDQPYQIKTAKWLGILILLCLTASSYWLLPAALGHGRIAESISHFDQTQRQAYATADTNGNGILPAVLGLQGFWADGQDLYIVPADALGAWPLVQLLLWMLVGIGIAAAWRRDRTSAVFFGALGALAVVLSLGVWNDWLVRWLPFFAGYREPQKFVALLAFAYSYFAARAVLALATRSVWKWTRPLPAIAACLLILLYTPTMLWGFDTQLQPRQYPADWFAVNARLNQDQTDGHVLFLPWHLYMSFTFAERIIANPAPAFFDRTVIISDDPEFKHAKPQFPDPLKDEIGNRLLPQAIAGKPITPQLQQLGIRYIILAKELDWTKYDFLNHQPNVHILLNTNTLTLYKIEI